MLCFSLGNIACLNCFLKFIFVEYHRLLARNHPNIKVHIVKRKRITYSFNRTRDIAVHTNKLTFGI